MASGAGPAPAHRSVANIRAAPTQGQTGPASPHTPPRAIASTYGSPSTVRADDDIVVIELGSRFVRIGFAGDSLPKATLQCGVEQQRRVGDFRAWQSSTKEPGSAWSAENEIWRYDLREVDLGLVQDKMDRLLREAFTKYLLIDSRPRRMALVLDSAVPLPLLSAILDAAFERFQAPMISLLSSATMSAVAAGVRSALVINMGWTETTVTSVYEYREVKASQTVRGGRYLLNKLYRKLIRRLIDGTFDNDAKKTDKKRDDETEESDGSDEERLISFDEMEDLMCRLMWCRPSASRSSQRHSAQLETVEEQDESEAEIAATPTPQAGATQVPLTSTNPPMIIDVQFEKIADICDDTFFDPSASPANFDDNELPVHMLVYRHLLQLPIDVRAICMSRIIFTGGCSNILGIKERILDEVTSTVERRGWEPVSGKGVDQLHTNPKLQRRGPSRSPNEATSPGSETEDGQSDVSGGVANADHDVDPIEAKVSRHRNVPQPTQGQIRALHSLGPWTGGSLLCQIKVLAVATIDRELWLQQGAHGASRPNEVDVRAQHRQSLGAGGLIRGSGGHHANWTLGTWGSV